MRIAEPPTDAESETIHDLPRQVAVEPEDVVVRCGLGTRERVVDLTERAHRRATGGIDPERREARIQTAGSHPSTRLMGSGGPVEGTSSQLLDSAVLWKSGKKSSVRGVQSY